MSTMTTSDRTTIVQDLVRAFDAGATVWEILRAEQAFHEQRRWSVNELFETAPDVEEVHWQPESFSARDRAAIWHSARAEFTTQPAGTRLAVQGVELAQRLEAEGNLMGAKVAHALAAWSARFWLEEESHHEVAFGCLRELSGLPAADHDEIAQHRGFFPDDDLARVCILQGCVEVEATVVYSNTARTTEHPLVRAVFHKVMTDEVQHRLYFEAFARALVESGASANSRVLGMAYAWLRPEGGETKGPTRIKQEDRQGFVNWWESAGPGGHHGLDESQIRSKELHQTKQRSILQMVRHCTVDDSIVDIDSLRRAYMQSLRTA